MLSIAAKEWMAEGAAKGKAEGKAEMLLSLLCHRFKDLPPDVEDKVMAADLDHLNKWSERLVDGKSLAEIFSIEQRH